jgi:hypothetical protein
MDRRVAFCRRTNLRQIYDPSGSTRTNAPVLRHQHVADVLAVDREVAAGPKPWCPRCPTHPQSAKRTSLSIDHALPFFSNEHAFRFGVLRPSSSRWRIASRMRFLTHCFRPSVDAFRKIGRQSERLHRRFYIAGRLVLLRIVDFAMGTSIAFSPVRPSGREPWRE